MFGGHGIYRQGVMFALIAADVLYFKADEQTRADFERVGSRPFTYQQKNRKQPVELSYWEAPPEAFERAAVMVEWATAAQAAAVRAKKPKQRAAKPRNKPTPRRASQSRSRGNK